MIEKRVRRPWRRRGGIVRSVETAGVLLKEHRFPADVRVPDHDHPLPKLSLTLGGGCTEHRAGRVHVYEPSSLQLNLPGSRHAYRAHDSGMTTFSATLGPGWDDRLEPAGSPIRPLVNDRDPFRVMLARQLHAELKDTDEQTPMAVEGLTLELLASVRRRRTRRREEEPDWLERVVELLRDEFARPLDLSRVAEVAGVHRSHLARTFRRFRRCTVGEYVRRLRVEFCQRRLTETDDPLVEIAADAGFADQSHFGRVFRRLTGRTPGEFRRLARG